MRIHKHWTEKADEIAMGDECATVPGLFSTRGRGGANRGGPGRRVLKLGVGGFAVRNPKNRSMMSIATQSMDDESHIVAGTEEEGRPKIRRPRKLRKPLLEDAYPANIQVNRIELHLLMLKKICHRNPFSEFHALKAALWLNNRLTSHN
jgi:hypothetical protein